MDLTMHNDKSSSQDFYKLIKMDFIYFIKN